jgi:hypothetical protein
MDILHFPENGTPKQLGALVFHRLQSFSLTFLSLIYREPGILKVTDVPLAIFDTWAKSNENHKIKAQFMGDTLVLTMASKLYDGSAAWIAEHIKETVRNMCPARDARVIAHTGCTSPVEFQSLIAFSDGFG